MSVKKRIAGIVLLQITLIIASFLTLYFIESEQATVGNSINVAGLNRYLTSMTINEFHDFEDKELEDVNQIKNMKSLNNLKENIIFLKEGGIKNGINLEKTHPEFKQEIEDIEKKLKIFEESMMSNKLPYTERVEIVKEKEMDLIESSDLLVKKLAEEQENSSRLLIRLQIAFLFINTLVHVLLILVIFRILNKETENKLRLERFAVIGKIGASVAHDLRNSLTVIKGSFDILKIKNMIKENELANRQEEKIRDSINKIEYLTKDILEYSQIRELNKEKFELSEIVKDVIDSLNIPSRIEIELPKKKTIIFADKIKIQTVISNLIRNAIDAIEEQGSIKIKLDDTSSDTTLVVSDSGKGFQSKDIKKIFEPLYSTKMTGTGLGLASCKRIVEEHGGRIRVKKNPTTFIIVLPKSQN